jgi:uncharacterized NAD(P)/FAD-binding protein YdhS
MTRTVAIIGGGFSGSLFALKLSRAHPDWRVLLIERRIRAGRGLAYAACAPYHLLNVPVSRMEVGLEPGFTDWLGKSHSEILKDALVESGGDLSAAFVSRELFGQYLQERVNEAAGNGTGFHRVRGNAVRLLDRPRRGVLLEDGREIRADALVLAMGNLPPRPPGNPHDPFYDTMTFIPDPWAKDAFDRLDPDAPLLLIGTGLTMVDIALKLAAEGHRGPMHAISRHGLVPTTHETGGDWEPFVKPAPPRALMRSIRAQVKSAKARGIPWQRVVDAIRPNIAQVWDSWTPQQRAQFLRHLRARWDVHRHRMAPRVAKKFFGLIEKGQLRLSAGRIRDYRIVPAGVEVVLHGGEVLTAARVINCTGPRSDLDRIGVPLIADLKRRGLILPDALGLGIETDDCAVIDVTGRPSTWLFALGPLTRPAWWEITAVPEIAIQVDRLADGFAVAPVKKPFAALIEAFVKLGSGI